MVTWIKQLFKLRRYFLVVYQYKLTNGDIGQGSCTAIVSRGDYIDVDGVIKVVDSNLDGEIETFLILNVIELNKKDFTFYKNNSTLNIE